MSHPPKGSPRSRSQSHVPSLGTYLHMLKQADGTEVVYWEGLVPSKSHTDSMDDWTVPDFSERIANGEIFNNPCAHVVDTVTYTQGSYLALHSDGRRFYSAGDGSYLAHLLGAIVEPDHASTNSNFADLVLRAKLRALASLDSTPFDFAEDIGEVRETLKFLRNPLESIFQLSKQYKKEMRFFSQRRRNKRGTGSLSGLTFQYVRNGVKHPKPVTKSAQVWLAYRFAASPILQTAVGVIDALETAFLSFPPRKTARGFENIEQVEDETMESAPWGFTHQISSLRSARAGILYTVSNPLNEIRFKYGIRNKDIPGTVWELLPLSFMIDRLVDIRSSINAMSNLADPNIKILAAWWVERLISTEVLSVVSQTTPGWTVNMSGLDRVHEINTMTRYPWHPTLLDAAPTVDFTGLTRDAKSIVDLLSLIIVNFSAN